MSAYLATIPRAVPGHNPGIAQSDGGSTVAFVIVLLLVTALVIMVGSLFRSVSDGMGNAFHDLFSTGRAPAPAKSPPIVPMPPEPDDLFRILHNDDEDDTDDAFVIVSADIPIVGDPKCFTCGRPLNKGDHSHS